MAQAVRTLGAASGAEQIQQQMRDAPAAQSRIVQGKATQVEQAITCLIGGGHLLLEDVPGVGKTTLAEATARCFGLSYARIQFTSDLMPADILGGQIYQAATSTFQFKPGPLFHQLVLADELNRTPPRTQSALLEAMAQKQVSLDGVTHLLPTPFVVIATQNPIDLAGTYPLPDSQLDRFLMRLSLGHPAPEVEARILVDRTNVEPIASFKPTASPELLVVAQQLAASSSVETSVADYAIQIASATRQHAEIERGVSTRAVISLMSAAKAHALWSARTFVTPGDVRTVLAPCLAHRLLLKSAAHGSFSREEAAHLLREICQSVPEPK
jgi:MoxR-like ATPase